MLRKLRKQKLSLLCSLLLFSFISVCLIYPQDEQLFAVKSNLTGEETFLERTEVDFVNDTFVKHNCMTRLRITHWAPRKYVNICAFPAERDIVSEIMPFDWFFYCFMTRRFFLCFYAHCSFCVIILRKMQNAYFNYLKLLNRLSAQVMRLWC